MLDVHQQAEIDALSNESRAISQQATISKADQARFDWCLARIAAIRSGAKSVSTTTDQERRARAASLMQEVAADCSVNDEKREASKQLRSLILGPEIRTYSPLATAGSPLLAQGFEQDLKVLMRADGPLFAGSPLLSNIYAKSMNPSKLPVSDDSGATGYVLTENVGPASDEAEINFSGVTFGSSTFSSGIILVSTALNEDLDAWTSTEALVKRTAAARLSRIMNAAWLPALKTALAANSGAALAGAGSSIVTGDVLKLVASVSAAYRLNAVFVMSPSMQRSISLLTDSNGRPVYRHVLDPVPMLAGYPVHIIASASSNDIFFGDFSYGASKSMPIELQTLKERFILDGYIGLILNQRADFQWTVASTSDSPVKYLTFA